MKTFLSCLLSTLVLLSSCTKRNHLTAENIVLPPYYSAGMVVPSGQNTLIAGHASPGGVLSVRISNYEQIAVAGEFGYWQVIFPPLRGRHAFSLSVAGADTLITLNNVLPGSIFLSAGITVGDPLDKPVRFFPSTEEKQIQIKVFRLSEPLGFELIGEWIPLDSLQEDEAEHLRIVRQYLPTGKKNIGIFDLNYQHAGLKSWLRPESSFREEQETTGDTVPFLFSQSSLLDSVRMLRDSARTGLGKRIARIWYDDESWKSTGLPIRFSGYVLNSNKRIIYLRKTIPISPLYHNENITIDLGFPFGAREYYFNEARIEPEQYEGRTFLHIPGNLISGYSNVLCIRMFIGNENAGIYGNHFTSYTADSAFYMTIESDWKYNDTFEPDFPAYSAGYRVLPFLYFSRMAQINKLPFTGIFWFDAPVEEAGNRDRITAEVLGYFNPSAKKYIVTPPLSLMDSIMFPDVYAINDSLLRIMADSIPAEIIILNDMEDLHFTGRDFESHSK